MPSQPDNDLLNKTEDLATALQVRFAGSTDAGKVRSENQDAFQIPTAEWLRNYGCLLVVADGVGGNRGGRLASRLACDTFFEAFEAAQAEPEVATRLKTAFEAANQAVLAKGRELPGFSKMATTLVAAYCAKDTLYIGSLGDSRLLRVRPGGLDRLTRDHSLVEELVEQQLLTVEEAANSPSNNVITRAVGQSGTIHPDFFEEKLHNGDWLVLCSDGLHREVSDAQIYQMVLKSRADPNRACESLVQAANAAGGRDNITVVAAFVDQVGE